ncbi:MAG: PKD domain-containing protein [Crocinitomicaceae bacterium]
MKVIILAVVIVISTSCIAQCNANFSFGYSVNPGVISFGNASTGSNLSYYWEFGDGGTSILQNPQHAYLTTGIFNACLTVTTPGGGCSDTYCNDVTVVDSTICTSVFDPGNNYPSVNGNTVNFFNYQGGQLLDYFWTFGDGSTSTQDSPVHTYQSYGTYTVCLEVSYTDGNYYCYDSTCQTITTIDTTIASLNNLTQTNFMVFPNPISNFINISMNSEHVGSTIAIIDILGNEIDRVKIESDESKLPVHTLPSGVYTILLTDSSGRIVEYKRIVKN